MMASPLVLAATLLAGAVSYDALLRLERAGRRELVAGIVLAVFFGELLIYQSEGSVPSGLGRLQIGAGALSIVQVVIALAAAARVHVVGVPSRLSATALAWIGFLGWYGAGGVMGWLNGNPVAEVFSQVEAVLTIGGAAIVFSGIRPDRLVRARVMGRWAAAVGGLSILWFGATVTNTFVSLGFPLLPVPRLGQLSVDAQLVLPAAGMLVLIVEGCRRERRTWVALGCFGMLATPLAGAQGAAYVGTGALVLVTVAAAIGRTWSRRLAVTPTEILLLVAFVGGSLIAVSLADKEPVDIGRQIEESLGGEGNARTERARLRLWSDAVDMVEERPLFGAGLGVRQSLRHEWDPFEEVETTPHNIALDVAVRTGLVGLVLLMVALYLTLREGFRVWRNHRNDLVAALGLGAVVGMTAFLANASVQSSLNRVRNTAMLGVLIGVVLAASASAAVERRDVASTVRDYARRPPLRARRSLR